MFHVVSFGPQVNYNHGHREGFNFSPRLLRGYRTKCCYTECWIRTDIQHCKNLLDPNSLSKLILHQITAAYSAAASGDTIYVYPGTYKEKITISKSGITIKGSAYPSLNPSANQAVITYATYMKQWGVTMPAVRPLSNTSPRLLHRTDWSPATPS